ncbi:MAG: hypothetical protein M9916_01470 [Crocinitomicaceae bacterium]|nr:hypothetical protein [Crocinitomicaceae bacterium]
MDRLKLHVGYLFSLIAVLLIIAGNNSTFHHHVTFKTTSSESVSIAQLTNQEDKPLISLLVDFNKKNSTEFFKEKEGESESQFFDTLLSPISQFVHFSRIQVNQAITFVDNYRFNLRHVPIWIQNRQLII